MNRIFLCHNKVRDEKVLLRLYGGKLLDANNQLRGGSIETEVLIFHIMAQKGIGPQLLGVFTGGRLEQYIENNETLSTDHCQDPEVMSALARKLAQFHATKVPLSKTPRDLIGIARKVHAEKWDKYLEFMKSRELPPVPEMQQAAQAVYSYDFSAYADWLEQMMPKIKTRVVLSHGDQNRANILVRNDISDPDQKVVLIDFEFACYGNRGCDIGMHFKNRTIDICEFMKGNIQPLPYPSEEERRAFIVSYLEEAKKIAPNEWDESLDSEFTVLLESEFYAAVHQLFFSSFIVKDFEQWKDKEFPLHPAVVFAGVVKDLEDRRANVLDLMQRGRLT